MQNATKIALSTFGILLVGGALLSNTMSSPMPTPAPWTLSPSPLSNMPTEDESSLPILSERMPDFIGITKWWNTVDRKSLTPESLKGKVVLIDFWTYSCINCIRTYPFLKTMHEKYADKGLVIVGVHTPEFAFEKDATNVEREMKKNGLLYPIALDPNYGTWNAYANRYWPAEYFFDREGRLRRTHFGEGEYGESEEAIRELLGVDLDPMGDEIPTPDFSKIKTPETYFGLLRGASFVGREGRRDMNTTFRIADQLPADQWAIDGTWRFTDEYVQSQSGNALFRFSVQAAALHLVLESADGKDKTIQILVDGVETRTMTISASTLYTIAEFTDGGRHTVEIRTMEPGVRFYSATFS